MSHKPFKNKRMHDAHKLVIPMSSKLHKGKWRRTLVHAPALEYPASERQTIFLETPIETNNKTFFTRKMRHVTNP